MPFGEEFAVGPQIPRNPGPNTLASVIPGGAGQDRKFGDLFGGSPPPMGVSGGNSTPTEPTFGDLESGGAALKLPERTNSAAPPPPTEPRNYEENAKTTQEQADQVVEEMRGGLPKKEAKEAEHHEAQSDYDKLIAQVSFDNTDKPAGAGEFDAAAPGGDAGLGVADKFKQAFARFKSGMGRSNKEVVNAARSVWGQENVQIKDGEMFFRPGGKGKFRRFDPKGFEFMSDLFLDMSGPILEGVVSAGTEAAGALATGAATIGTALSPAAPLAPAVAVGGMAATQVAAAGAGVLAHEGAINALDAVSQQKMRDEDVSLLEETAWNAGFNFGGLALGAVAKNVVRPAFKKIIASMPENRIKALADIRFKFDDFVKNLPGFEGSIRYSPGHEPSTLRSAGKDVFDAVDAYGNRLEDAVKMVKGKAVELAESTGRESFPTDNLLLKLKDVLQKRYVKFDSESGLAVLESKAKDIPGNVPMWETERMAAKAQTINSFGKMGGERNLQLYVDQYNALLTSKNAKKGLSVDTLQTWIDAYSDRAVYNKAYEQTSEEMIVARELRNAASTDRHLAYDVLFKGSGLPEEEIYRSAFDNFSKNIDDVIQFRSMFNQRESATAFARALVQPENIERIQKLKGILGEGSREWTAFRGEWVGDLVERSVRKSSGILDGQSLLTQMADAGKEVLGAMLSKEEQGAMRKMAIASSKIPYADLLNHTDKDMMESIIALTPIRQFETTRAKTIWTLIGRNKLAADYLLDEGWMKMASEAKDNETRQSLMGARKFMADMVSKMKVANVERINPKTGKKTTVQIYVPIGRQSAVQAINTARQADTPMPEEIPSAGSESGDPTTDTGY